MNHADNAKEKGAEMKTQAPAFQFYPKDYLSSENVMRMSLAEQGAYVRLLCHAWLEGSIPSARKDLARMVGVSTQKLTAMWPSIERCFDVDPNDESRLISPRLMQESEKQTTYRERAKKGGQARAKQLSSTSKAKLKPSTSTPSPSPSPVTTSKDVEAGASEEKWNNVLAPLIREHLWRGKKVPPKAPSTRWSMGDELKTCRELLKLKDWDVERVERVIVGFAMLRDRNAIADVEIGEPATMRRALFDQPWGAQRTWAICEDEWHRQQEKKAKKDGPSRIRIDVK